MKFSKLLQFEYKKIRTKNNYVFGRISCSDVVYEKGMIKTITADDDYNVIIGKNYRYLFKCNYSNNERLFGCILLYFWNLHLILSISKEADPSS